jgi:hypothetical protein
VGGITKNIFHCDSQLNSLQEISFYNKFFVIAIISTLVARDDSYSTNYKIVAI